MYVFLSGGAGVRKSVVLRALYQALLKCYNHRQGENPDNLKRLLCAPAGKKICVSGDVQEEMVRLRENCTTK